MLRKVLGLFIFFLFTLFHSQAYYAEIRNKYWEFEENDEKAFTYVNIYIKSAKKEKNYKELFQAYNDAIRYSPNRKLQYADSSVTAAHLSKDPDIIGNAYLAKGSVYYFTHRKFKPALHEYLKAYKYLENSDDQFLKERNLYYIGTVKSYLGYYSEAAEIFRKSIAFFKPNTKGNIHPNLIFNNRKGYLNALHQLIVCEQATGDYKNAVLHTVQGLKETPATNDFEQERSYFYKTKGINEIHQKNYDGAISDFNKSITGLKKVNDFSWISAINYYSGLSYQNKGDFKQAVAKYKAVDSIFAKHQFIFPQTRKNYEELIDYYKKQNDPQQELFYTKQLLKVDSVLTNDFKYLANRIHREYDTKELLQAQAKLENKNSFSEKLVIILSITLLILGGLVFYWFKTKKDLQKKYNHILSELDSVRPEVIQAEEKNIEKVSKLDAAVIKNLKEKFKEFEKSKRFLEKGLTAGRLAAEFETNATYFSQFVSEFKDSNFNTYLNNLRIKYAVDQIYNHKEWRKYSVEDIALACGFSNRQSFSNFFYEQNGMRPAEFLKKRNEEVQAERKIG
ncbi:helix-turn-helix domain-containing protein [Chryseobacterium caseinilyticum]|uniref:AraC family transcriptional regulator n=1 Tax=Chryseobacterium caseinilyticum TaxID=2771428 RepID=A0ABR8Z6K6_9FLAO|nr:helix-turn-helix domain-containing protein [Chryseobacterium caseinilyticum]MBD8080841.1 AraC family transcriptional regulator [Chryseobacterium caseinilyticum]